MQGLRRIAGFIVLVALFVSNASCSDDQAKQGAGNAVSSAPKSETKSAADGQVERTSESVPKGEAVVIPLDQIRGLGQRGLRDLEPDLFIYRDTPEKWNKYSTPEAIEEIQKRAEEQSLVLPIERAMAALSVRKGTKPRPGFAVKGTDRVALQGVYDVLVKGEEPIDRFPAGTAVSVVFFAHPAQPHVGIDRVERIGERVEIDYVLISHGLSIGLWNLALIPLGQLPAGTYRVEMVRAREKEKDLNQRGFPIVESGMEKRIVCGSFSFTVVERE